MIDDPLAPLRTALSRGDALLIVGQDHTPELVDGVLADANALFRATPAWRALPQMFVGVGAEPAARSTVTALFAKHQPTVALLELASIPWASVLTTAVDPVLANAFLGVGNQRRVVELGAGQLSAVSAARSGQLLQLIRAFGTPATEGPSATPTSPTGLAESRLIRFPGVLATLPRLVGLHGHVVVAAWSDRDWLDEQSVAALCHVLATLPAGRVFWFGAAPASARSLLGGKAHFEELSLHEQIRVWAKDEHLQRELGAIRERVFGTGDRVLTIEQDNARLQLCLSGQEWRSISRVGSLLDDNGVDEFKAQVGTKPELVAYLRRSHVGVPDWSGPARGFVFEREQIGGLIRAVREFVSAPKASIHGQDGHGVRRVPFVLSGSPASGKTVGLLQAAWTLRAEHHLPVLWLLPGVAGLDFVAIERVCRLLESKGVRWTILFLDGVEVEEYFRLKRRLESDGRRVIVVGSESRMSVSGNDDISADLRRFALGHQMSAREAGGFPAYLRRNQVALPSAGGAQATDFLRVLSAAIPEAEFGALPSLLEEYERLVDDVEPTISRIAPAAKPTRGTLAEQLRQLFPTLAANVEIDVGPTSRFAADPALSELLNLVLFCAQLERPISVDLLFKVLGSELIGKYPAFAEAFAKTALVQEVELDQDGNSALTTSHQLHAMWLLRGLFPDRPAQLDLLRRLATSFDWKPDAFPGEEPHQDFILGLLRAVGPRGEYRDLYRSRESLDRLRRLIGDVREQFAVEQPKLLTLEAIILGDLAVRDSEGNPKEAKESCRLALDLLGRAEEILRERRPSDARNFELQRTLTLASDVRGTFVNIKLRGDGVQTPADVEEILGELSRIEEDAVRAQSYSPTYHPLDVVCWAHRDALDYLPPTIAPSVRARLVETIEQALEVADEEGVESSQISKFQRRHVELRELRGESALSEQLAQQMREKGDFSGDVSLARRRLLDVTDPSELRRASLQEFARLYAFRPKVLRDVFAVRFLHTLWVSGHMMGKLGDGSPKLVKAPPESWRTLEDVARARLSFADQADLPYALFFLGWALYELDEPREGAEVLSRLERQSVGNPRRVGELAFLTTTDGRPRTYRAKVVSPRAGQVRISIPELDSQMMDVRPEVESRIAPAGLRLGEFVEIAIALNYRGAHARPPRDEPARGRRT